MCKFQKPQIPANATADERRKILFDALYALDLNDKCEKFNDLSYLSWANAWAEFKSAYPSATYSIKKNPTTGLPYSVDPSIGIIVFTEVTVDEITHEMWLPVMNSSNKAMKLQPYSYQVYDKYKKQYVEKTVEAASMFDINKTIMRCLVKNLAMFGLGLYIYTGDDMPEKAVESENEQQQISDIKPANLKPQNQNEAKDELKRLINTTSDIASLVSIYLDNTAVIESSPEIKTLLTNRKKALQSLNA